MMGEKEHSLPAEAYSRMALVMRAGLAVSLGMLIASLAGYLYKHWNQTPKDLIATNPIMSYISPSGLLNGMLEAHTEAFMTLAIIILAATPALRVLTGFWYMLQSDDRALARIAICVFVMLMLGYLVIGPLLR